MTVHDFTALTLKGEKKSLSDYKGKTLLIVNTASKCGLTPQYKGLQALYDKHKDSGLEILGFPCNQFLNQEPGSNDEIQTFCEINYGVSFPLFAKIDVNGSDAHPLFRYLIENNPDGNHADIEWNFAKFLVNGNGKVVRRYHPQTEPADIEKDLEQVLRNGVLSHG